MKRFWDKVDKSGKCWLWIAARRNNYGAFKLNGKVLGAHVVAYTLTNGPIEDGLVVCHSCDNPPCVNPSHLWLGTYSDNAKDAVTKGRMVRLRTRLDPIAAKHQDWARYYAKSKVEILARKRDRYHRTKSTGV